MLGFRKILITSALVLTGAVFGAAQQPKARPPAKLNPTLVRERRKVMSARPLAMYYYVEDARGLQSAERNADQISLLGLQCFTMDVEGIVRGAAPAPLSELARREGLPLMPLLVNPRFDRALASTMLRDLKLQERTASYLAFLANRDNYVGWQLDLEHIDPADKFRYTAFVRRVAAKLHRDGRLLSIAVTPRFSDRYPDTRAAEFRTGEWGAPFDFRALGQIVDFMVLMTYDHHNSSTLPGPVAGYDWLRAALDYAVSRVPRHKLLLGIPFYGREWVDSPHGVISRSMGFENLRPLLERPGVEIQWDDRWRTPWMQFQDAPDTHTVWFDDSRSYKEKLGLVRKYRLRGFAAWRLGTEDPQYWTVATEFPKAEPAPRRQRATQQIRKTNSRRVAAKSH